MPSPSLLNGAPAAPLNRRRRCGALIPVLWLLTLACPAAAPGGSAVAAAAIPWQQGVYIWDSRALLDPARRGGELERLRAAGLQRLLVGVSAAQLRQRGSLERELMALIRAARSRGLGVELLLGDPSWMRPRERHGLLSLIERLRPLPFQGLHLDLEVEQLGWPVPAQRLQDWLNTLQAVQRRSPWPLSISAHPRWFEGERSPCVPCGLRGLTSISLMVYQRPAERAAVRSLAIARRWPALRFRLAQSVEPQLPTSESWHGSDRTALGDQVRRWRERLEPGGLSGIDWQDWTHYPQRI